MPAIRIGIQLPESYDKKARAIAKYKGTPRATWIANLVQARIEEIYPKYLDLWEQDAKEQGINLEEFMSRLAIGDESDDE